MDNVTSENSTGASSAEGATPQTRVSDSLRSAFQKAADDARKAADEAIPRIKAAAAEAAYWTSYGVTFAAVFQWTLVKGLTPESVKSGSADGAKAGKQTAERWAATAPEKTDTTALLRQVAEPRAM